MAVLLDFFRGIGYGGRGGKTGLSIFCGGGGKIGLCVLCDRMGIFCGSEGECDEEDGVKEEGESESEVEEDV